MVNEPGTAVSVAHTTVTIMVAVQHIMDIPPIEDAIVEHRRRALIIEADDDIANGRVISGIWPDGVPIAASGAAGRGIVLLKEIDVISIEMGNKFCAHLEALLEIERIIVQPKELIDPYFSRLRDLQDASVASASNNARLPA